MGARAPCEWRASSTNPRPSRHPAQVWVPQHEAAGKAMYELCVGMRGFYLKVGARVHARTHDHAWLHS